MSLPIDDLLDGLVAEYSDLLAAGRTPAEEAFIERVPREHRDSLRRCLRILAAGVRTEPRGSRPLAPGVVLGGYEIVEELGRGGMAVVYRARQPELDRDVALKVLRPGLALEPRNVDRFRREGLAIARFSHPHVVGVHDVGEDGGHAYIAMEYVRGTNLADAIRSLPPGRAWTATDLGRAIGVPGLFDDEGSYERAVARLLEPIARVLGLAHELGCLHRDVKPSNILIHADGRALLADFGLAKGAGDPGLSLTGEPLGTPHYMSPEQVLAPDHPVDQRSDVYSLGVTLYEALSGRRPHDGPSVLSVLDSIRQGVVPGLCNVAPQRSREAQAIVERAMAREPGARYPRALDLASDLAALAEGRPSQAYASLGGSWKRLRRALGALGSGRPFEYRSPRSFLGWPLVHVLAGPRQRGRRVARGWIACGPAAVGGLAIGGASLGLVSFGGVAGGLLLSFAGCAVGLRPVGGVALGGFASGGSSIGYAAVGGLAIGHYALGGKAIGRHTLDGAMPPAARDPEALAFFDAWLRRDPLVMSRGILRRELLGGSDATSSVPQGSGTNATASESPTGATSEDAGSR